MIINPYSFVNPNLLLFDSFSMTHAGIWATKKYRTAYTGACVRVKRASDSVEQDIGFDVDGWLDMAAYTTFGTGNENVVLFYDQSGNGFDRVIPNTNNIKIDSGIENGRPTLKGNANMGEIAGFTDWNGLADLNIYSGILPTTLATHYAFCGGSAGRAGYVSAGSGCFWWVNSGYSEYNTYAYGLKSSFQHLRWQFDGGGASDVLQGRMYSCGNELTGTSGAAISTTLNSETGLYFNSSNAGGTSSSGDVELYYNFYLGYELTAPEAAAIDAAIAADYAVTNLSHYHGVGDSNTAGYVVNVTNPGNEWTTKLSTLLTADLSRTFITRGQSYDVYATSEVGASTARVLQIMQNALEQRRDYYKIDDIVTVWAGTNDIAGALLPAAKSYQATLDGILACVDHAYDNGFVCSGNGLVPTLNLAPREDLSDFGFVIVPADVNTGTGNINHTAHGLITGQLLTLTTTGTLPLGLSAATNYFVIYIDADNFKLAATYADSQVPTPITGGTTGTGQQIVHYARNFNFEAASVTTITGDISRTAHNLNSGQSVYLQTTGTLPLGLSADTRYFIIVEDANTIKLALTYADSQSSTAITGGTAGTGTQTLYHSDNVTFAWDLTDVNAGIASTISGKGFIVDIAAVPELSDPTDGTYFNADKVHFVQAGQDIIRDTVAAAIEPYL
jgi:lysophospholipase L1-like esterase